ncbi:MAG TPA: hypothetical protein VK886_10535 [Vicinamibacterales bacterium]|nr:hypothetical protein [Vicinamibacterales bacterium]
MVPSTTEFTETFETLRAILKRHGGRLRVTADAPAEFMVASRDQLDRVGRPLAVAGVQIKKNYVSYHLIPVYVDPALLKGISPALRKRMQGKSCFNFTSIDPTLARELAALTKNGIERFKTVELPWASAAAGGKRRSAKEPRPRRNRTR